MYQVKKKKFIILGFLHLFFTFVLLFPLLGFSYLFYDNIIYYNARSVAVEAKVIDDEKVIYYYEVNDHTYTCEMDLDHDSEESVLENVNHKRVRVTYHSSKPDKCGGIEVSDSGDSWVFSLFMIFIFLPGFLIFLGLFLFFFLRLISNFKMLHKINTLNKTGKLIKYYPCEIENHFLFLKIKRSIFDRPFVFYEGKKLYGLRYFYFIDSKFPENYVDLLIDEKNPKIYYMDYRIDRKEGNRKEDYYEGKIIEEDE